MLTGHDARNDMPRSTAAINPLIAAKPACAESKLQIPAPPFLSRAPSAASRLPGRFDRAVPGVVQEAFPGQGHYEYMRQRARELQQRDKPQPTKTVWAIGSMEWLAEQKEAG